MRAARSHDTTALETLIERSIRGLGSEFYSAAEVESSLRHLFGVDSQIIDDGTYFVVEHRRVLIACGGWSRRKTPFGGNRVAGVRDEGLREPGVDAAVIRAFFVHPSWTRRGLGRLLVDTCEAAARAEGFDRFELTATPMGHPLYAACGYRDVSVVNIELPDGVVLPNTLMVKP